MNWSFIVYCKRSSVFRQLPSVEMSITNRHAHVRIGPIVRHIRNAYQKCLPEKLTYFIATLLDIRTSFCALIRRQTVTMVYAIHGPAATQATIFYTVWKRGFAIVFVSIMQYCFTCLIVVEKQLLASH